ncbi:TonB-dependent siderophore receptor [Rubrivivax gelatinosus]|nr:TonB-dependent siderophore receptor [Rubrivivax gelatinosus]
MSHRSSRAAVPRCGLHPAPLALALQLAFAAVAAALVLPDSARAQPASAEAGRAYSIPAGALDAALARLAAESGLLLAAPAELVQGRRSPGLQGRYAPEDALRALLVGSGLQAARRSDGAYTLLPAAEPASAAPATLPPLRATGRREDETATGPVDGYVARRSASASRTDTALLETPQSVSVVGAEQLAAQKAVSLADGLSYTPGVAQQSAVFSRMVDDLMVRGFNVANGNLGMLRDGMKYQSNVYDGGMEPYGLERLELVRGAASVLYGQLSPGGLVNAVSKRPTVAPLNELNLEFGSYDRRQLSGDFGGAIDADGRWSWRLTALARDADNWVHDVPDDKRYVAPALSWQPDADTRLTLLASRQSVDTRFASPLLYEDVASGTLPRRLFLGEPDFDRYDSDTTALGYEFEHRFANGVKLRSAARRFDADVRWDYMMANLAPVSGGLLYRLASARDERSSGRTADNSLAFDFGTGALQHTLLAGIDYYRRTYDSHRWRGSAPSALDLADPVRAGAPAIDGTRDRGSDNLGEQTGLYLQDQMRLGRWALTAGARYDSSRSHSRGYLSGARSSQKDDDVTGRAGLVYLFDSGWAPYLSVSQSFQPQIGTDSQTGEAFTPSRGRQVEAGLRWQPADSRLLLAAALYELRQTDVVTADANANQYQQGEVRSRGFELEARWQGRQTALIGAFAFTDARVRRSQLAYEVDQQVAMVPRQAFSLWSERRFQDFGLAGLKLGLGLRYTARTNIPERGAQVPGYTLVDAMLGYELGELNPALRGATVALNARNLFDREFFTCTGSDGCRYGEPSTWTATIGYRW